MFWGKDKAARKTTILTVDDSETMRTILSKSIKELGYDVLTASDGHLGVESALKNMPDLILMDVTMPGMTGLEALIKLKGNPKTAAIPVLMCSAEQTGGDLDKAFSFGAAGYMIKPVTLEKLKAKIEKVLPPKTA